jgi:CheY-like chemotaxis protein
LTPAGDEFDASATGRHGRGRHELGGPELITCENAEMSEHPATRVVRVVVADDQAAVRDGLVAMLSVMPGIEVVGEAADGAEAVDVAVAGGADVVLMDLHMPGVGGVAATWRIGDELPGVRVVVLTTYADDTGPAVSEPLRRSMRSRSPRSP